MPCIFGDKYTEIVVAGALIIDEALWISLVCFLVKEAIEHMDIVCIDPVKAIVCIGINIFVYGCLINFDNLHDSFGFVIAYLLARYFYYKCTT